MKMPAAIHAGKTVLRFVAIAMPLMLATSCAQVNVPDGRSVDIPTVTPPLDKFKGVNEKRDGVTRVRLGRDVLVPQPLNEDPMPDDIVGPYELRGETLASALQLILDEYDVSLAFESDSAMTTRITVANLRGELGDVVDKACELANLYCHYQDGSLVVKDTETFVVDLPPLASTASETGAATTNAGSTYDSISEGLQAITGTSPTIDETTRVMIYTASQRAHKSAVKYFDRLRKNTALIVYETHIWEVQLNNDNRTGINWNGLFNNVGNFTLEMELPGGAPSSTGGAGPISITPSYDAGGDVTSDAVLDFISERGVVRTVSQPQLTVLSGSSATLTVEQSENFVSGVTRTPSTVAGVPDSVSTTTDTVDTGLEMSVTSAWDQSTVYGTLRIELNELLDIDEFQPDENTTIQLPQTTARTISTQIRVRPGDAMLIAGLVTEKDDYSASGPGFLKPLLQTARSASTRNTELVFLLRPRVIAFVPGTDEDTVGMTDAMQEQKKPDIYIPSNITDDVSGMFGGNPEASRAKAEVTGEEPALPVPPGVMAPVPAAEPVSSAPLSLTDAPPDMAPARHEMSDQPVLSTSPDTGLPSWLPSQRSTDQKSKGGTSP